VPGPAWFGSAAVLRPDATRLPKDRNSIIVDEKIRSTDPRLIPYRSILKDVGVNADGTRVLKGIFGTKVLTFNE
jgi:hypothetical protein